jgi:hypothetical protein
MLLSNLNFSNNGLGLNTSPTVINSSLTRATGQNSLNNVPYSELRIIPKVDLLFIIEDIYYYLSFYI